jgi:hypothetical protein
MFKKGKKSAIIMSGKQWVRSHSGNQVHLRTIEYEED